MGTGKDYQKRIPIVVRLTYSTLIAYVLATLRLHISSVVPLLLGPFAACTSTFQLRRGYLIL
ncbi:hypothetical protein CPC08DRAFT_704461 [Agrocybe pediades]|nr:hypothetical protein CPC08DRAFT_704461 [Agrocybe pediades]